MARKKRTPEENARREKIRELLQMANIGSMDDKLSHFGCLKFCLRTPFTTAFNLLYLHATEKADRVILHILLKIYGY